jgi:hypothetical protein
MPDANPKPKTLFLAMCADRPLDDAHGLFLPTFDTLVEARRYAQSWQDQGIEGSGHRIIEAKTTYRVVETTPDVKHVPFADRRP